MDTSISASTHHTEVSAASTAFNPPHVHFFNLDDFAGHEIHAILEDGEKREEEEEDAQEAGSQKESVRPGSVDWNIEQRLGDMTDFIDDQSAPSEFDGAPAHSGGLAAPSAHLGAGSSSAHAMAPSAGNPEQMRMALLEQMQYRELSHADIQLLLQLEAELESLRRAQAPSAPPAAAPAVAPAALARGSPGPPADSGPSAPS
tara:strand:- start:372 stop:977 length:606 start_codon:yes stop_codon:yes gene_type:complete